MKKRWLFVPVFFLVVPALFAQDAREQSTLVSRMDASVKELSQDIHRKLIEGKAEKIAIGQFTYRGATPPLGTYWVNQLTEELANIPQRPYILLSGGLQGADRTISGEIVEVADTVRVFVRLVRSEDRSIEATFHTDFERASALSAMLAGGGGGGGSGSPGTDEWEPDSWENPVLYDIGSDENVMVMNRAIQPGGDEDFFLLVPDRDGRLIMETTGSTDTYMEFYDAETRALLDEDDDGGQGSNARIRYNVQAGRRYIAKVRGYSSSTTGNYAFRAYMQLPREGSNSWNNPIPYEIGIDEDAPLINRTLERDDEDHFLLVPETDGRLVMETTGSTDTYMEFYDAETRELLASDDDGGQGYNARIRYSARAGRRYIAKVRGYSSSETGNYGFRAYLQVQNWLPPDEYEPDDEPSQARLIEIGRPQEHTFHSADDVDWVKFQITKPGGYIIRARGVNSNRLDTYIELFDSNLISIAEDDDGGANRDSRLSLHLENGLYYLKVWCLDDEPNQPYTISIVED